MAWKFGLIFALLTIVSAIEVHQHHHHHAGLIKTAHVEYADSPPEYEFSYSVHDHHTGDIKSQKESRKDDKVEGSYELIDSDGHRRLVQYTADDHHGFQAIVHREPTDIKIPIPEHKEILHHHKIVAAPVVHYTPVHKILSAPVHHHAVYAPAPAKIVHSSHSGNNHVSFSGPHHSYNY